MLLIVSLFSSLPAAPRAQDLDDDKRFLNDVRPLILPDERALFEKLEDEADRRVFQEIFWARRDPNLATPGNEFQQQYLNDRKTADRRYSVPGTSGSATDCGRLFVLAGKPDRIYRNEPLTSVVVGGAIGAGQPSVVARRPEVWVYRDRRERRIGFDRLETSFDEECRGWGDIAHLLDRIAATKIIHPDIDYEVGRDGHLVAPADQFAGETPSLAGRLKRSSGRLGPVAHDSSVPRIERNRLHVSTPVLSEVRVSEPDGPPGERLAITARRDFTPEAALRFRFEVYGAARLESSGMPRVSTSYEVRRSDGALYTRGARSLIEPTADGAVSRVVGFPLRAATADDYEIVVRIKDELSGKTHELREMFSVTSPTATAAAPPPVTADTRTVAGYLELVERSCVETDAAILALSRWSSEELERVAQELFECDRCRQALKATAPPTSPASLDPGCLCPSPPWARAAALHTDLAFAVEPEADGLFHLGLAARLLERSGAEDLRRWWYRAVGLNCLFLEEPRAARSYLEEGLELFEDDPALLVALGATYEAEAWELRLVLRSLEAELIPVMLKLARVRGEQRRYWSDAADLYEQVLARDPEHSEARLRLGCVELLRDHKDRGLAMLRWVTEHAGEPDLIYLAHLFIGRELKRSGDLDGALTSYRAALETDSLGQAAYIATSHALRMSGRSTAAADVLERGLATRRPELTRDSWWRYPQARLGHTLELLTQMGKEICQ